jgi:phosphoribosylanthranilate isomerase
VVKVKICGIKRPEDALSACVSGADLLGFVFVAGTPRAVTAAEAGKALACLSAPERKKIGAVGLFRDADPEDAARTVAECGLDHVQLHGSERPSYCLELKEILKTGYGLEVKIMKVFRVEDGILPMGTYVPGDYAGADYLLFDTFHKELPGGTGRSFNWEILNEEKYNIRKPFFIAGGLNPDNVAEAVRYVSPYGVDVSSGVEEYPGKKDERLIKEFIYNAKNA